MKKKGKYNTTLAVKGDFLDVLRASARVANKKTKKKRKKASK